MSDTVRGVIIFAAALFTIALWVPLSGDAQPRAGGGSINNIYFGLFRYLTIHSELKEPDFTMTKTLAPGRLAVTVALSTGLWVSVIMLARKTKLSTPNPADSQ